MSVYIYTYTYIHTTYRHTTQHNSNTLVQYLKNLTTHHFCPLVAIPTDTRLPAEWRIAALARPPSNTESAMPECFLTTECSLFGDTRLLVFSPDAKDSVSISDLRLFSSVSASDDLSISPSILSASDLESWSSPLTDGLSSRILPSDSEPIEMVLSLQTLTRLVVDFLLDDLLGNNSVSMLPLWKLHRC